MTMWSNDEFNKLGRAEELKIASLRSDGPLTKPVPIGIVCEGGDL